MFLTIILLSCVYIFGMHAFTIPVSSYAESNSVIQCINKIYSNYFKDHTLLISSVRIENFFSSTKTLTLYQTKTFSFQENWKYNHFIFIIENITEFENILKALYKTQKWNSRGKYLIGYVGSQEINSIFNISWQYSIYNINIVRLDKGEPTIHTFFPYDNSCGQFTNYYKINSCNNFTGLYLPKIPNDLKRCPIKIVAYPMIPYVLDLAAPHEKPELAGLEVTIMHVLGQRMNMTPVYVAHNHTFWGYRELDGQYRFTFGDLIARKCDLVMGMQFGNVSHLEDFDGGVVHLVDSAAWWVPTAQPIAQWKNLTAIFSGIVWSALLISFLVNGFIFWLTGRNREQSSYYNDITLSMMSSLQSLLQGSVLSPKTSLVRFVYLTWILSTLLIYSAHQCQLVSILTSPLYDHQITSLEEVVNSTMKYGMFVGISSAFSDPENWVHAKIYKSFFHCPLTNFCLNRTAFEKNFAAFRNLKNSLYFVSRLYTGSNGKILIYPLEFDRVGIVVLFYTTKGFPLLERINHLLLLMQSSGLISKWDQDTKHFVLKTETVPDHEPLKLNHLQGAFYILLVGFIVASITFLCELFRNCYVHRQLQFRNAHYH